MSTTPARTRRRLSRTLSRARWDEYARLLEAAEQQCYHLTSLEPWLLQAAEQPPPRLILMRHDVDQHPRSALRMSDVEQRFGVTSTWYFRWRTADPDVIGELRRRGCAVGLHYETLTRQVLREGLPAAARLEEARRRLADEVAVFQERFGPIVSITAHGDTRVRGVSNLTLMLGQEAGAYGVRFDANIAMRGYATGLWLTDRSAAEGGWENGIDPHTILKVGITPILCLTHPNNWASGPALWIDRAAGRVISRLARVVRRRYPATGSDEPPIG